MNGLKGRSASGRSVPHLARSGRERLFRTGPRLDAIITQLVID